jgi:hypothetical protein
VFGKERDDQLHRSWALEFWNSIEDEAPPDVSESRPRRLPAVVDVNGRSIDFLSRRYQNDPEKSTV